ncbi:MAG: ABC transporter permease, partial [Planctomycetota bacterium]
QQFFKGVNVVGIACAVLLGTSTVARERESGTLELLLSRPISRGGILWSKAWVLGVCLVVPIYLSSLSIIPLSKWVSSLEIEPSATDLVMNVPAPELLMASTHASLFVLLFLAGAIVFSVMFRTQMHVAFVVGGLIVLEVGIYFIQVLRHGSIFMLADHDIYAPIMAGNVQWKSLFLGTGIWIALSVVLLYGLAHWRFKRMDI